MLVILESGAARRVYRDPRAVICAETAKEVPAALSALEAGLANGLHAAGWFAYEMGCALEPRLAPLCRAGEPLLRVGLFAGVTETAPAPHGRAYAGPLRPEWDEPSYLRRFETVKAALAAGDIYQANLSFRARFSFLGDPLALYESLRGQSGAAHCAYVADGARHILSLSPELFFELSADGILRSRPMKGTAPRKGEDAAERAALAASGKDRAENLMIVDLIRNDLGRIAQTGSVAVENLFQVETYPTLHTMVSTVRARKHGEAKASDLLRALFPCGSVTGAPKIRAMEILHGLETSPRGAYCGAVGYFAPDGSARFNVAIRTLTVKDGHGELGIGGGVVQDSRGHDEYAECLLKARFFESPRRPLELIETLRFEQGFVRLDRHLARMAASAAALGLAFEEAKGRAALTEAVAGAAGPLRVRLTLDESGRHHATAAPLPPTPAAWTYRIAQTRTQSGDALLRHKTGWREIYESAATQAGADEVVFCNERGEITEGARSNIFVRREGTLLTPPLAAGLLGGCLRSELIESGAAREARLMPDDLAGSVLFGNSLRGLIPGQALQ